MRTCTELTDHAVLFSGFEPLVLISISARNLRLLLCRTNFFQGKLMALSLQRMFSYVSHLLIAACIALLAVSASAASIQPEKRADLQSVLRIFIEKKTQDGQYTFFNEATGEVVPLRLKTIHPVIFANAGRYVLCADFETMDGEELLLDYVLVPIDGGYLVEKELIGRLPILVRIFEKLT